MRLGDGYLNDAAGEMRVTLKVTGEYSRQLQ